MKKSDKISLIIKEYKFGRLESIVALLLQTMIFTVIFFMLTISFDIDNILGDFMLLDKQQGYEFYLHGYSENETDELASIGFENITAIDDGYVGYRKNLDSIWPIKINAIIGGKDIWNPDFEEMLDIILFFQITFLALGIIMLIILFGNVANAINMKLMVREKYINMLVSLGCQKKDVIAIYFGEYSFRMLFAILFGVFLSASALGGVNSYIHTKLYMSGQFTQFNTLMYFAIAIICFLVVLINVKKHWRSEHE